MANKQEVFVSLNYLALVIKYASQWAVTGAKAFLMVRRAQCEVRNKPTTANDYCGLVVLIEHATPVAITATAIILNLD